MLTRLMLGTGPEMKSARVAENRDKYERARRGLTIDKGGRRIARNAKDCTSRSKFESKRSTVIEHQDEKCSIWKFEPMTCMVLIIFVGV